MIRVATSGLVVLSLLACSDYEPSALRLRYELQSAKISIGSPLVITVTIDNPLPEEGRVDLGWNRVAAFAFTLVPHDGRTEVISPEMRPGVAVPSVVIIPSKGRYESLIVLDRWRPLTAVGSYALRIDLSPSTIQSARPPLEVVGKDSVVTVTPRDEVALRVLCEELVYLAIKRVPRQIEAAVALSYVRDPVALPFLRQLLVSKTGLEGIVVDGLGRIGTAEAVDELERLAQSSAVEPGVAAAAKFQLARLKRKVP